MKVRVRLFGKNVFIIGTDYQKKANLQNYYQMVATCKNCNNITGIYIKKGVHFNNIIAGVPCSNCECRLEKKES
jgi:hypothetical protein